MGKSLGCVTTPCTKQHPCVICGGPDWCFTGDYGVDGKLHFCARRSESSVISGGFTYISKKRTEQGYTAYEEEEQNKRNTRRWVEEQKRTNPDWVNYGRRSGKKTSSPSASAPAPVEKEHIVIDEVAPLSNDKLDQIYRYFLSLLVLEDYHRKALLDEWNSGIENHLGEDLIEKWHIVSIPENDRARFTSKHRLKNRSRKDIMAAMIARFGTLKGVPGFYRGKDGNWRMSSLSGIAYPIYDSEGYLYRIRIGDEHPELHEYAKDANGYVYTMVNGKKKNAMSAIYRWDYSTGEWYRESSNGTKTVVYSLQRGIFQVSLNNKGYPVIDGKVNGKYKNFSSRVDVTIEKEDKILVVNKYSEGTRSGSNISLYCSPEDDFTFVYVTEGEKKAMVMNRLLGCPAVSLPGVGSYGKLFDNEYLKNNSLFRFLLQRGMKAIIIVYDADKTVNEAVLMHEKGVLARCKNEGVSTFVGEWNPAFGKGGDDILIQGNRFSYFEKT